MGNKLKIIGTGFGLCLLFVAGWEGKSLVAYRDIVGVPTICYGHTDGVQIGDAATDAECRAQLNAELQVYWDRVDDYVTAEMQPWEHVAFTSFAYNLGLHAFAKSTMLKRANEGNMAAACLELIKNEQWSNVDCPKCRFVQGLSNRRHAEFKICIGQGVR
jgi:lysozyme